MTMIGIIAGSGKGIQYALHVIDAGESSVNGGYIEDVYDDGKGGSTIYYRLASVPTSDYDNYCIKPTGLGGWDMIGGAGLQLYSTVFVTHPWGGGWFGVNGANPAPTVTEG
jgi:hypothetical protein